MKYLIPISLVCLLLVPTYSFSIPLDFDADNLSNPATVEPQLDNSLTWKALGSGGEFIINNNFGQLGQHLVNATYNGTQVAAGTISSDGTWNIDGASSFTHGATNALYIAGADYDGDGKADAAYTTSVCENKRSSVFFKLDPLNTAVEKNFRISKGFFYRTYLDVNNDGKDEFCWARPLSSNGKLTSRFNIICKDVLTNTRLARFSARKLFNHPQPLRNQTAADYLVTYREVGANTRFVVYDNQGFVIKRINFNKIGTVIIGQFQAGNIEQIVVVDSNNQGLLYNIETQTFSDIAFPTGIPFDEININYFSADTTFSSCYCNSQIITSRNGSCQKTNETSTDLPTNPDLGSGVENFRDGSEGNLWKPVSESGYPEHNGKLVVLLHNKFAQLFDSCTVKLKAGGVHNLQARSPEFTNGNRQTWRSTINCNEAEDVSVDCTLGSETVKFTVEDSLKANVCDRQD